MGEGFLGVVAVAADGAMIVVIVVVVVVVAVAGELSLVVEVAEKEAELRTNQNPEPLFPAKIHPHSDQTCSESSSPRQPPTATARPSCCRPLPQ